MTALNTFSLLSASTNGKPIIVSTTSSPGTLIHTAGSDLDSLWIKAGLEDEISFLDKVYLRVLKGTSATGYVEDAPIIFTSSEARFIETGIPLTNIEYRLFIDSTKSTVSTNVTISGYVHTRS